MQVAVRTRGGPFVNDLLSREGLTIGGFVNPRRFGAEQVAGSFPDKIARIDLVLFVTAAEDSRMSSLEIEGKDDIVHRIDQAAETFLTLAQSEFRFFAFGNVNIADRDAVIR